MQSRHLLTAAFGAAILFLANPAYASYVAAGTSITEDWSNSASWTTNMVPTGTTTEAIISGGDTMTIDSSVPSIENFQLGGAGSTGTLTISAGGSLVAVGGAAAGSINAVGRPSSSSLINGVTGILNITGGSLTIQNDGLSIGSYTTGSYSNQSTATATFSGGTYSGGLLLGTTSSLSTGALTISGTGATIGSYSSADTLKINSYGTLDFVLNGSGAVSVLNYANNAVTLGGTLDIDLSNYTGASETINLIDYSTISGSFATTSLIGTGSTNYSLALNETGSVVQAVLTETAVPEPETWVLVFMGMAGLAAVVRRREVSRL